MVNAKSHVKVNARATVYHIVIKFDIKSVLAKETMPSVFQENQATGRGQI